MADFIERQVRFPAAGRPAVMLEGSLALPGTPQPAGGYPVAVLCHPQPAGSSMEDPLLKRLAADLAASGLIVLRFNFRGVGASEGEQTDGRLEPLDIAGAIEFARSQTGADPEKLCLIGHAFGAYMALAYAAHDPRVKTVVAISPPVFRLAPDLGRFERPRLFLTGEYDEVSPRHKLEPWIAALPGARNLRIISGARHLMRGYEAVAADVVVHFIQRWAETPGV
jgi:alpha/beta superfamily hydrolase